MKVRPPRSASTYWRISCQTHYSKHYRVSADELAWLSFRVEKLGQAVHGVCTDRIDGLESDVT